jgi:hypothetical protein
MHEIDRPIFDGRFTPALTEAGAGAGPIRGAARGSASTDPADTHEADRRAAPVEARSSGTRDPVETGRRAALGHTIDRFSENATAAATAIVRLAHGAESEAVRLRAARAVLADFMTVENYAFLCGRMAEIERRPDARCPRFDGCHPHVPDRGPSTSN